MKDLLNYDFAICSDEEFEAFLRDGGNGLLASVQRQYGDIRDEDLRQELRIAAAHAIARYDAVRIDVKMTTFVWECCQRQTYMYYRKQNAKMRRQPNEHLSFEKLMEQGAFDGEETLDNGEPRYKTFTYNPNRDFERQEAKILARKILDEVALTGTQLQVVSQSMNGVPQSVIAKQLGFSQSKISKIYNEALDRLRQAESLKGAI